MNTITIKTNKNVYPQIYAYITPKNSNNDGWVKIGYTEKQKVEDRIKEQTHTAGVEFKILWFEPAKFSNSDEMFKDKQLHNYLRKFKHIKQRQKSEWFFYNGTPQNSYIDFNDFRNGKRDQISKELEYELRNEQKAAVEITLEYAQDNEEGEFLWNAKPRFGKTLTTYDLAIKMNATNVLVVTNRPAIANSWFDDFESFIAWQTKYSFVSTLDPFKDRRALTREQYIKQINSDSKMIAFVSLQDLKGSIYFGGTYNKLEWVKNLKWDLLVIDEAHEGIDTFKTDVAFDNISRKFTLHLSGTPFKAVACGKFKKDQIYNWTYADEQKAKSEWKNIEENNPYEKLPRLNLFSYQMSQMITNEVNKGVDVGGDTVDYAFDLNEFFETKSDGSFVHESDVKKWLDTLTSNEKYPFSTKDLRDELKHTFWLLNRVASAKALQQLLKEHLVFENYEIILAAGDGKFGEDDENLNKKSLERVKQAIKNHDKTITLSVGQLTTGVTIPQWSAVMMLSNLKSPSLYMQAAFRAQNPYSFEENGQTKQKDNAYVFDFAPERTLIIYDEFANNLSLKTSSNISNIDEREENIKKLLNFFPVIAEDSSGKMVELDVNEVLTIPKLIKAREVVKRGFMSNFLFQNISGIFASTQAREILEQLNPVEIGKLTPKKTDKTINTQNIQVNSEGEIQLDPAIVVAQTQAHFGEKIYQEVLDVAKEAIEQNGDISKLIQSAYKESRQDMAKQIAKDNGLNLKQGEIIAEKNANIIAQELQKVQSQKNIEKNEAEIKFKRQIQEAQNNTALIQEVQIAYEKVTKEIDAEFNQRALNIASEKSKELDKNLTQTLLEKAENKKKDSVEDDVRARLRGFSRTIPSFLMAYGRSSTNLSNFDEMIEDKVFKEVTGISLEQFKTLRDTYNFFDSAVFDESIQEFLKKRSSLANYFEENQDEDIFDYIPPQKTNQIYTPKKVVKIMIDALEEQNPDIFKDKNKTFVDLYVKSGLYLTEIIKRLYIGLEKEIPDKNKRIKHILQNQIYGFAPSEIIYRIARNFIFGFDGDAKMIKDLHIIHLDTTPFARGHEKISLEEKIAKLFDIKGGKMKFDAIVGNPPYQENDEGKREDGSINASASPLYHFFVLSAQHISDIQSLIIPIRWASGAGKGLGSFTKNMLKDKHIKVFTIFTKSDMIFPNTDIKGGVGFFVRDSNYIGKANITINAANNDIYKRKDYLDSENIGLFIPFNELKNIYMKVKHIEKDIENENMQKIASTLKPYGLRTDFFINPSKYDLPPISNIRNKKDDIEIIGLLNNKRESLFVSKDYPIPSGGGGRFISGRYLSHVLMGLEI